MSICRGEGSQLTDYWWDEVRIFTRPQFKTSDLSGKEWRTPAVVQLVRKGNVLYERGVRDINDAVIWLPWGLMTVGETKDLDPPLGVDPAWRHVGQCLRCCRWSGAVTAKEWSRLCRAPCPHCGYLGRAAMFDDVAANIKGGERAS